MYLCLLTYLIICDNERLSECVEQGPLSKSCLNQILIIFN